MDEERGLSALQEKREALDRIDDALASLLLDRWRIVASIGSIKAEHQLDTFDPDRESAILDRVTSMSGSTEEAGAVRAVFQTIFIESKALQKKDRL